MRFFATVAAVILVVGLSAQEKPIVQGAAGGGARDALGMQQQAGTGIIAGTLTSADAGRPVRRARVSLSAIEPRFSASTMTDDDGHFQFKDLPDGRFDLTASKAGFVDSNYGQKVPGNGKSGTSIVLAKGQRLDLKFAIQKGSVLTGTVVDERGEPVFGAQVRSMRFAYRGGERALQPAAQATTDDRGVYRIPGLLPGEYIVSVTVPDVTAAEADMMQKRMMEVAATSAGAAGAEQALVDAKMALARAVNGLDQPDVTSAYAPVFYPGTTVSGTATPITLGPGEERGNVDVPLQLVPVTRVNGIVLGVDGQPVGGVNVQLVDNGQVLPGLGSRSARSGTDGKFSFTAVPPGSYTVTARQTPAPSMLKISLDGATVEKKGPPPSANDPIAPLWAMAETSTDGRSPGNVSLMMRPGMIASGRVTIESAGPTVDFTRLRIGLSMVGGVSDGSQQTANPDATGNFSVNGLSPGRYRVTVSGLPGSLKLKSASAGGREALDFLLDVKPGEDVGLMSVVLSDKTQPLSGALQDAGGQPMSAFTVIVFAADQRYWTPQSRRVNATRPGTDGTFSFRDLPAGDYLLATVTDVENGQWFDPAFLRQLVGSGVSVRLLEGQRATQNLRVR